MNAWLLVAVLAAGTIAMKVVGPLVAAGATPPAALVRVITLMAPALLAALVVAGTFARAQHLAVDARAAGVAVGLVALLARAPVVIALVLAALATALLRAV